MSENDLVVRYEIMVETIDYMDETQYDLETIDLPFQYDKDLYNLIHEYFESIEPSLIEVRSIKIVKKDCKKEAKKDN